MIYYFDKHGREHKVPQVVKAMEEYKKGGLDAMHKYLQDCAARGEISKADAFHYESHLMSYRWEG